MKYLSFKGDLFMKILILCILTLTSGLPVFACQYSLNPSKKAGFIQGNRLFLTCERVEDSSARSVYSCTNDDPPQILMIDKATGKSELDGRECEESRSHFINFCLISGSC